MTRLRLGVALLGVLVGAPDALAGEAEVAAAAEAALAEAWPSVAARAEVRVVRLSGAAAEAEPPLRVRFLDPSPPRGRTSAVVEVEADGAWARAGWAYLEVAHHGTVAVLTRDVARGEPVADALRPEAADVTDLPDALSPDALGDGWTAARSLRAGTVLTGRLVAAPAAVERGDPVRVVYARGAVRIALDGEARERGAVGDEVRVYCDDVRSTFRVRLTGPGAGVWVRTL